MACIGWASLLAPLHADSCPFFQPQNSGDCLRVLHAQSLGMRRLLRALAHLASAGLAYRIPKGIGGDMHQVGMSAVHHRSAQATDQVAGVVAPASKSAGAGHPIAVVVKARRSLREPCPPRMAPTPLTAATTTTTTTATATALQLRSFGASMSILCYPLAPCTGEQVD
jgi:hypothetical protein